jgi:hypothetical protein
MTSQWEICLDDLEEYLTDKPDIKIGTVVSIPPGLRDEFYNRFDRIRAAVVGEVLPQDSIDRAKTLIGHYTGLEKELTKKFHLKKISLELGLEKFRQNPEALLMEELYFPLFDLLKGKTSKEIFINNCRALPALFDNSYRKLYGKWVALSLLKLCKAREIMAFSLAYNAKSQSRGGLIERKPSCMKADFIEFSCSRPFVVPDFAAYCPEYRCYLAVKTEMNRGGARFAYGPDSQAERKWTITAPELKVFTPDNIFVYVSGDIQEISLLVNKAVCCPDALIRCFPQDEWYTQERWQETLELHEKLSPKTTCVIGPTPANENFQADGRIKIVDAGLEYLKLEDIAGELIAPFKTSGNTEDVRGVRPLLNKWRKWFTDTFTTKTPAKRYL